MGLLKPGRRSRSEASPFCPNNCGAKLRPSYVSALMLSPANSVNVGRKSCTWTRSSHLLPGVIRPPSACLFQSRRTQLPQRAAAERRVRMQAHDAFRIAAGQGARKTACQLIANSGNSFFIVSTRCQLASTLAFASASLPLLASNFCIHARVSTTSFV